jgi:putative FmdB family regulatory protein
MPIYEYVCQKCGHAFELFVRGNEAPRCPACESEKLERKFSVFGVGGGGPSSSPGPAPGG